MSLRRIHKDMEIFKRLPEPLQGQAFAGASQAEQTRQRLVQEFHGCLRRLVNAQMSLEELLTEEGFEVASQAVYAADWRKTYFEAEERWLWEQKQTYWTRLWNALLNRHYQYPKEIPQ